jgi:hypothetical protein
VWPEGLDKLKNFIQLNQSHTCDLPTCMIVITLGVTLHKNKIKLVMLLASFPSQIQKLFNISLSCFAHFNVCQKSEGCPHKFGYLQLIRSKCSVGIIVKIMLTRVD